MLTLYHQRVLLSFAVELNILFSIIMQTIHTTLSSYVLICRDSTDE